MKPGDKLIVTCPICGGSGDVYQVLRDQYQQQRRDAEAWAKVRAWLDAYTLTAEHFRRWTSHPLHVERLTEECTRALYEAIEDALQDKPA